MRDLDSHVQFFRMHSAWLVDGRPRGSGGRHGGKSWQVLTTERGEDQKNEDNAEPLTQRLHVKQHSGILTQHCPLRTPSCEHTAAEGQKRDEECAELSNTTWREYRQHGAKLRVQYLLLTRKNEDCAQAFTHQSVADSQQASNFVVSRPTKVIIHGYRWAPVPLKAIKHPCRCWSSHNYFQQVNYVCSVFFCTKAQTLLCLFQELQKK